MSDQKKELAGLFIVGTVNARETKQYKDGKDHFFLYITSVGSPTMRKVEVRAADFAQYADGADFKSRVIESCFNNQITYTPSI